MSCSLAFHFNFIFQVQVSVDVHGASASSELNMWGDSEGSLYASQAAGSYLRFPATASACADCVIFIMMMVAETF